MQRMNGEGEAVAFEDAKHFQWRIIEPQTSDEFPSSIYYPAALQVSGIVVVMGRRSGDWPNTRVIFYDTKENSWSIVHSNGASTPGREKRPDVLGLVGERVFVLDAKMPVVRCFDLVLRDWTPLDVKGFTAEVETCARCFMENINSFIYWDSSKGAALSVLDLESLRWSEQTTKGELPIGVWRPPSTCSHGSTVYLAWARRSLETALYVLSSLESRFYWSRPKVNGRVPEYAQGSTLTYYSGRLFKYGGFGSRTTDSLQIYSIDKAEWHDVGRGSSSSDYTMQGENPLAGAHSTVALKDKLIVFGGLSVFFNQCRFLEARKTQ